MRTMTLKSQDMSMGNQFLTLKKLHYVVLTLIKIKTQNFKSITLNTI